MAEWLGCSNAKWMDKYSQYRKPSIVQAKHHWLWKIRFVFEHLVALSRYDRNVIFLEEDHYVVEDILHVLRLVERQLNVSEPNGVVSFGSYTAQQTYTSNEVNTEYWVSSRDNMGMGISRAVWRNLSTCLKLFCQFDDYNWDWSLYEISAHCIPNHLKVFRFPSATRVYHLGNCIGLHHRNVNCSVQEQALIVTQRLSGPVVARLYPPVFNFKPLSTKRMLTFRANGGWADPRDHALCQSMATASWNSSLLIWAPQLTAHSPIY
ncbi:hypothetical protein P879_02437 [Paragonimus westermani]|uniref:Alpha-1,6-mannosyl-glycoprotein 2-beta-N-acetylglucosaminyltransferase n=1 Tax=Paragonimus westermani TaxID=34504 RepID=A0A8T0DV89_9TREM|nr:hypothetical protein P879_02437 [Paragonimus westermani]